MRTSMFADLCQHGQYDGKVKTVSSLYWDGAVLYSYGEHYPLAWKIGDTWIKNDRGYSVTTSKHIGTVRAQFRVELDRNVHGRPSIADTRDSAKAEMKRIKGSLKILRPRQNQRREELEGRMREIQALLDFLKGKRDKKDWKHTFPGATNKEITDYKALRNVAMVAQIGDILLDGQKEKNDWKARMLKAGLENSGLIMPDDWDQLSEDEKERRLNGAIAQLK